MNQKAIDLTPSEESNVQNKSEADLVQDISSQSVDMPPLDKSLSHPYSQGRISDDHNSHKSSQIWSTPKNIPSGSTELSKESAINEVLEIASRRPLYIPYNPRPRPATRFSSFSTIIAVDFQRSQIRGDVMNKNIFRAFRRELKRLYEEYLESEGLSNNKRVRCFICNIKKFSDHLLTSTPNVSAGLRRATFMKYVGILVDFCAMKRVFNKREGRELTKQHRTRPRERSRPID